MTDPPDTSDFNMLASSVAGRPMLVVEGDRLRSWTDGEHIHLRRGCPNPRVEVLIQAALIRHGALDLATTLPRRRGIRVRYTALEASRAVAHLPPTLQRHITCLPDAQSTSSDHSMGIARSRAPIPEPIEAGEIRPRELRTSRAAADGAGSSAESNEQLRSDAPNQNVEPEGTALPKLMNAFRSPVSFRRRRNWSLERAEGKASVLGDFASAGSQRPQQIQIYDDALDSLAEGRISDGSWFPEWAHRSQTYRRSWCQVEVITPPGTAREPEPRDDLMMRRALVHLHDGYRRQRRQRSGDDIDLDAAIDLLVERAAGSTGQHALYIDQRHRRRDLSVQICLDVSGSAADRSPSGGTVHQHQVETANILTSALGGLGHRVAVHGFRSNGRTDVQMLAVKRFDEPFDAAARARLRGLDPAGRTRLGTAVRWGRRELEVDRSASHRLLIVISDGFAYDLGYEGAAARLDARRALLEARASGVASLCVSVGAPDSEADLAAVFGSTAYLNATTIDDLITELRPAIDRAFELAAIQSRHVHGATHSA